MKAQFESIQMKKFEKNCIDKLMMNKIAGGSSETTFGGKGPQQTDQTVYKCTGDSYDTYFYGYDGRLIELVMLDRPVEGKDYN